MTLDPIRKSSFPLEVTIEKSEGNLLKDIYVTELGHVMISVYNKNKKVTINYSCGGIERFLPEGVEIKTHQVSEEKS